MKELEDRAHAHGLLLSSDAMRHFIATCPDEFNRIAFLDRVITGAKVTFPSEDGWVVLSLSRMQQLCEKALQEPVPHTVTVEPREEVIPPVLSSAPVGVGSLAEAIVAGNVVAAYQLIENRPMIALADAAADLDTAYRTKQGVPVLGMQISELLKDTIEGKTAEQLAASIQALTSAIDGTYSDEKSAVRVAIMKAINAIS